MANPGVTFRLSALFLLLLPATGRAADDYPRHAVTPEIKALMVSGLPPEIARHHAVKVGDPLPGHVVIHEDQVQWLVEHITKDPVYVEHLKYGYFARGWPGQWPRDAALRMLELRLDDEESRWLRGLSGGTASSGTTQFTPSPEWLRIASVVAFAQTRMAKAGWMVTYERLWRQAVLLKADSRLFRQTLAEYLNADENAKMRGSSVNSVAVQRLFPLWFSAWLDGGTDATSGIDIGGHVARHQLMDAAEKILSAYTDKTEGIFDYSWKVGRFYLGLLRNTDKDKYAELSMESLKRALDDDALSAQSAALRRALQEDVVDLYRRCGLWDMAIQLQRQSVVDDIGSIVLLARLYNDAAMDAARKAASAGANDPSKDSASDAPEDTAAMVLLRERDKILRQAVADTKHRDECLRIAALLVEYHKEDDAVNYLETVVAKKEGGASLPVAVFLADRYVARKEYNKAGKLLEKVQADDMVPGPENIAALMRYVELRAELNTINEGKPSSR